MLPRVPEAGNFESCQCVKQAGQAFGHPPGGRSEGRAALVSTIASMPGWQGPRHGQ